VLEVRAWVLGLSGVLRFPVGVVDSGAEWCPVISCVSGFEWCPGQVVLSHEDATALKLRDFQSKTVPLPSSTPNPNCFICAEFARQRYTSFPVL